nr:unnamed protein product [Digitaria exilis]
MVICCARRRRVDDKLDLLKKALRWFEAEVLKGKGMLKKDAGFYSVVSLNEKTFAQKFLDPYKESVPWLADAYVAASVSQSPPVLWFLVN